MLLQIRRGRDKIGSVYIDPNTQSINEFRCRVGKVVKMGELAYRDRKTGEPWKGGPWCKVGDYIQFPPQGGVKYDLPTESSQPNSPDRVEFIIINDENCLGVLDDPYAF